jgi:hypothetical protein
VAARGPTAQLQKSPAGAMICAALRNFIFRIDEFCNCGASAPLPEYVTSSPHGFRNEFVFVCLSKGTFRGGSGRPLFYDQQTGFKASIDRPF